MCLFIHVQCERCASHFWEKAPEKHAHASCLVICFFFPASWFCAGLNCLFNHSNASAAVTKLEKAYKPMILLFTLLAFHSAMVTLLAKSIQRQGKLWKPFISSAGAQISQEIACNILSLFLSEGMPPHFLCVAVMQRVRSACAYLQGSCCLSHSALT